MSTDLSNSSSSSSSVSNAATPSTISPSSTIASKAKSDDIVLGPGGPGGFGSFFAAFAAGAGGGGVKSSTTTGTGKDAEENISLRPQTGGFMKKPFIGGNESTSGEKQSHHHTSGGKGGKGVGGGSGTGTGSGGSKEKKKYVYTTSFLRKFQSAGIQPPADMTWYLNEVKANVQDQQAQPIAQLQQRKPGGSKKGAVSGQDQRTQAPQQPPSQPQEDTLPHRQSANPWLPRFQTIFSSSDPQQQYRQKAVSAVTGVLNKLTLEHFDSLSSFLVKQLKDANGADLKEEIIQLVFDKAISEPNFSTMYASLCQKLNDNCSKWKKGVDQEETFRNVLLSLCQKQFEKSIQRDGSGEDDEAQKKEELEWKEKRRQEKNVGDDDATIDEDWEELRIAKIKKRNLGNVRFVGELFKKKLLPLQIIHDCIQLILKKSIPHDEDIEILCNLLNTVGKSIDITKTSSAGGKGASTSDSAATKAAGLVDAYFKKMDKLAHNNQYPARIRFMLMDTIELRENKWVPRKEQNAPQKIADIHAKAYEEDLKSAAIGQAFYAHQQATGQTVAASPNRPISSSSTSSSAPRGGSTPQKKGQKDSKQVPTKVVSVTTPAKGSASSSSTGDGSAGSLLETELGAIIEEYINSADWSEALACLQQLNSSHQKEWPVWFVFSLVNLYVEKKERDRQALATLLDNVTKESFLSPDDVVKGFGKVFATLEDLEIDVPHATERVGELASRLVKGGHLSPSSATKEMERHGLPEKIKTTLQTAFLDSNVVGHNHH